MDWQTPPAGRDVCRRPAGVHGFGRTAPATTIADQKGDHHGADIRTSECSDLVVLTGAIALLRHDAAHGQAQRSKPAPRLANGKPDFTGVWDHPRVGDITKDVKGTCAAGRRGCTNVGSGELPCMPAVKANGTITTSRRNTTTGPTVTRGDSCAPYNTPYPHVYVHHPDRLVLSGSRTTAFRWSRPMDARFRPIPSRRGWAHRQADGKATRSSSSGRLQRPHLARHRPASAQRRARG